MKREFDTRRIVSEAHNYVGLPFPLLGIENLDLPDLNKLGKAIIGKTILGRPYFMDCIIDGYRLPNEPLITITGRKNIAETIIVGSKRKGTVKEFISAEDYVVKIEGVCIEPNVKEYPEAQVKSIIELCEKNEALEFDNDIAELFRIRNIVIKDYGFGNMKGKPHSQSYYIQAVSNEDFYGELTLGLQTPNITRL